MKKPRYLLRTGMALLLCAAVAAAAQAQQPSTSGMDEFYSNGGRQSAPAPGGGPMYGNGQYGRDAQCGGTDRAYYNKLYGSTAIVLDVVQAQQLYRATQGQIWYRCGGCGEQTICWPRPGYEQLLAQAPPRQGPPQRNPPAPKSAPPLQAAAEIQRQWNGAGPGQPYAYGLTTLNGQKLHAVKVTGGIAIDFDASGKTLQQFVRDHPGAHGAVTGTFSGYPKQPPYVAGAVVQNGKLIEPPFGRVAGVPTAQRSFLGFGSRGFFVAEIGPFADNEDTARSLAPAVQRLGANQGLGGLGRLLDGGRDVHQSVGLGRQQFGPGQISDGRNARAVAGVSGDGRTLILLVEEGNGQRGLGAGINEMGAVLRDLGATDAVIMDSGGSAQIYLPSAGANNHPNDARRLPTAIVF